MFCLIKTARSSLLPIDLQVELFDKIVKSILKYGSEVWGFGNNAILKRTVLNFLKFIFNMESGTPHYMVYGETCAFPIYFDIQCRIISFWAKTVLSENPLKLFSTLYGAIYSLYTYSNISTTRLKWIKNVKEILTTCGMKHRYSQ